MGMRVSTERNWVRGLRGGYGRDEGKYQRDQSIDRRVVVTLIVAKQPRRLFRVIIMLEGGVSDGADDGHDRENKQVCQDHRVHLPFDLTPLAGSASRIKDELGVETSVHNDADDPPRIPQDGTAEQRRLEIDGRALVVDNDGGGELVHQSFGALALDLERAVCARAGFGVAKVGERRDGVPRLEVGLAVQIFSFDKRDVVVLARRADENVGRDALVIHDLDKVAYAQVLPRGALPVRLVPRAGFAEIVVVFFVIGDVARWRSGLFESFGWDRVRERLSVPTCRLCNLPSADALR